VEGEAATKTGRVASVGRLVAPVIISAAVGLVAGEAAAEDTANLLSGIEPPEGAKTGLGRKIYKGIDYIVDNANKSLLSDKLGEPVKRSKAQQELSLCPCQAARRKQRLYPD